MLQNKSVKAWKELWPELFQELADAKLGYSTVKLSIDEANADNAHITQGSIDKFATKVSPTPIFFLDFDDEKETCAFVIRFCDAKNAKEQDIDPNAKSFLTVSLYGVAHVGIEMVSTKSSPVRTPEGFSMKQERDINIDGSVYVKSIITKLIRGQLEGRVVK